MRPVSRIRNAITAGWGPCAAITRCTAVASLLAVGTTPASGQCEIDKLVPSGGSSGDSLGDAVDICGDVAIVGGFWTNAVYIYRFDGLTWAEEAVLVHDGTSTDSVAVAGNFAAVGDGFDSDMALAAGAVHMFRYDPGSSEWMYDTKMFASDSDVNDKFGSSLSMSDERMVVGADGADEAAYVFQHDGSKWIEQARLSIEEEGEEFARSVGIDGDVVVVGAFGVNASAGAAYVYRFDGLEWVEEAELVDEDGEDFDLFGFSVGVSGNVAVAGAHGDYAGSAFVYRFDGTSWIEEAKLVPPDDLGTGNFGASLSVSGDVVVVSMLGHDENGVFAGAAYVSRYDGLNWPEPTKLLASDGVAHDSFGMDVAVDGDVAVVGANGDDLATGAAYIFAGLSGVDCNGNGVPDACDLDEGTSVDADGNGVPDECGCLARSFETTCPDCGYDLRGADVAGCPECGWQRRRHV